MTGIFAALAFFGAIAAAVAASRADGEAVDRLAEEHRRLPDPGYRDVHALTGTTLGRAHVPSWG